MDSRFDGTVLELLGINLAFVFLTTVTFGLAYPWALAMKHRYVTNHSIVEGQRLRFDGTGGELFVKWLKIGFLTIITLGVYYFWAELEIQRWIACNTHFDGPSPQPIDAPRPVSQQAPPAVAPAAAASALSSVGKPDEGPPKLIRRG